VTTEQLSDDGWHRLHPLSPLVRSSRGLIAIVVLIVFSLAGRSGGLWDAVSHLGVLVIVALLAVVSWLVTRWRVEDGALRIETGLIRRSSLRYPLAQIQAIDTVRPGLARLLGLSELRLRMGGSSAGSARLAYLTSTHAEDVREELLRLAAGAHRREETASDEPVVPAWVEERRLVAIATPQLVASIALSGMGVLVAALLVALIVVAVVSPHAAAAVVSSSIVAILALATGIWRRFNGDYGLTVTQATDGLRLRSGLVQTSAEVIPHGRVQAVRMVEPILWRPLGWARLEVDLAGRQRRKGENRAESKQLRAVLPVGLRGEALELLGRILPGAPAPDDPPPLRARWKSPLRFHNLAVARTDELVATRSGRLARVTVWVPLAKAQSFRWSQGPVQRRLSLADVFVDTAGRRVGAAFRDRDAGEARAELDELAAAGRRARQAGR
jgi:putative membrane protein